MNKTFKVDDLREHVNAVLAFEGKTLTPEFRRGAAAVLETVLHRTDTYAGFSYLGGWPTEDETRRRYNRSAKLGRKERSEK